MLEHLLPYYIALFARLCVGGVLVVSGIGKLLDREGTAAALGRYPFVSERARGAIARYFPLVEVEVGTLLIVGLLVPLAAVAAALLLLLFTGLVVYDLSRGSDQSCHCFGRLSVERLTPFSVVRNMVLLGLALVVAAFSYIWHFDPNRWLAVDHLLFDPQAPAAGPTLFNPPSPPVPAAADALPVALLALLAVGIIVLGGQLTRTIRGTLHGLGMR